MLFRYYQIANIAGWALYKCLFFGYSYCQEFYPFKPKQNQRNIFHQIHFTILQNQWFVGFGLLKIKEIDVKYQLDWARSNNFEVLRLPGFIHCTVIRSGLQGILIGIILSIPAPKNGSVKNGQKLSLIQNGMQILLVWRAILLLAVRGLLPGTTLEKISALKSMEILLLVNSWHFHGPGLKTWESSIIWMLKPLNYLLVQ